MKTQDAMRSNVVSREFRRRLWVLAILALSCSLFAALSFEAEYERTDGLFLVLKIRNSSPLVYYENLSLLLPGLETRVEIEKVEGGQTYVERVGVERTAERIDVKVRYTFCEGDVCQYREEEIVIRPERFPKWVRVLGEAAYFAAIALLCVWLWPRTKKAFVFVVILIALTGWVGIRLYQHETVRSIASTLCISCVGLEVVPDSFEITAAYIEEVLKIPYARVEVFHTDWCLSCPVVIDFLEELAMYCDNLELVIIDAQKQPGLAEEKGVYSGNTMVVPTTIVNGTARITGAERFPERFLKSLREVK